MIVTYGEENTVGKEMLRKRRACCHCGQPGTWIVHYTIGNPDAGEDREHYHAYPVNTHKHQTRLGRPPRMITEWVVAIIGILVIAWAISCIMWRPWP